MIRFNRLSLACVALLVFSGRIAWLASAGEVRDFSSGKKPVELLIRFQNDVKPEDKARALKNTLRLEPLLLPASRQSSRGNVSVIQRLTLGANVDVSSELARLVANPGVAYVEPNYRIKISETTPQVIPNDLEFSDMYALQNTGGGTAKENADIRATEAWAYTTGSTNIIVAVIDTGLDYFHQDLQGNIWRNSGEIPGNGIDDDGNGYVDDVQGYDFVSGDSDPFDDNGHGTHVSGTIGAVGNNGIGTVGVCWRVSIMPVKAFDQDGNGSVADAINAIDYAVANGARIINASWGLDEKSRALEEAVNFATDAGVLFVAAAGNSKTDVPSYPAAYTSVIAVGATDEKDQRASFSNFGAWVSVSAPGLNILSTLPENSYGIESGTSMATPHVSGVAALVLSRFPEYSREELREILLNSVDPILTDKPMGNGRINASLAVQMDEPLPFSKLVVPETISGTVDLSGSAYGRFFTGYSLRAASASSPTNWIEIASSVEGATNRFLGSFDTSKLPDGDAIMQLVVTNRNGSTAVAAAYTKILNVMLSSPQSGDILAPGVYPIRGTVFFNGNGTYKISMGSGVPATAWTEIASGAVSSIKNGNLAEWDTTGLTNGFYALRLEVSNELKRAEYTAPGYYIERHLKTGWPVYLNTDADFPSTEWRNIRAADLDGDGKTEFVIIDPATLERPQTLMVYSVTGDLLWSRDLGFDIPPDIPAIGDVDGDGKMEIFVDGPKGILGFHYDGTPMTDGWPIEMSTRNHAKVLADVDQDGKLELITYSQEYALSQVQEMRELSVYKMDGSLVRKWQLPWCGSTNQVQKIFPAVANLDDEPGLEIVTISGCSEIAAFDYRSAEPKWRAYTSGALLSSPVIGDVDANGQQDVIVAAAAENGFSKGGIYIFNGKGEPWSGWPILEDASFSTSPALGDLDRDGRLEIVVPSSNPENLHVVQWDGFEADGWPQDLFAKSTFRAGVCIANIDHDEQSEIILTAPGYPFLVNWTDDISFTGGISAWKFSGEEINLAGQAPVKTLPMELTPTPSFQKSAPCTIGDFDGDGKLDLVAASIQDLTSGIDDLALKDRSSIYVWGLNAAVDQNPSEWPMFGHGLDNNGFYPLPLVAHPGPTNQIFAVRDRWLCPEGEVFRMFPLTNDLNVTAAPLELKSFTQPSHGIVLRQKNDLLYIPNKNYTGPDTFNYTIHDINGAESTGSVYLLVKNINDPPVAENIDVSMKKNSSVDIIFNGSDPDNDPLKYRVLSPPANGDLWNYPSIATYYPKKGFFGTDSFTYVANDGRLDSPIATVTISVINSNNPPSIADQSFLTKSNRSVSISPSAEDIDGDPLTFFVTTPPLNGSVAVQEQRLVYTPATNFLGPDQFFIRAFDGTAYSSEGKISISIISTNAAPVAQGGTVHVQPNISSEITLHGVDPDGDDITVIVLSLPLHGQLEGDGPTFVYRPAEGYEGPDRISFKVTDGVLESKSAVLNLNVIRENRAPKAEDQTINAILGSAIALPLQVTDEDKDPLQTIILKGPARGLLYGIGTNLFYSPVQGALGEDQFTYKAWDGQKFGNVATVTIYINTPPGDDPPQAESLSITDAAVKIEVLLKNNKAFEIQSSTNLTGWSAVSGRLLPQGGAYTFTDTNAPTGVRFYRAINVE